MQNPSFSLQELAEVTKTQLIGDPKHRITNVADLDTADENDASFLANPRYEQAMRSSKAGVIFIAPNVPLIEGRNFLVSDNPSRSFQTVVETLHANANLRTGFNGIHPTAVVHPTAKFGKEVVIGPHAVIDQDVTIGDRTFVGAGVYCGVGTTIGDDCTLHPHVTIRERCHIGNRVILQPGAVIGSCGFGYTTDAKGKHTKLNQVGTVTIDDDVEIGANTTIDRSRFKTTRIGRGTKIDNQVQIAHGVIIGEDNIIVSQVGIAGSSKTGRNVILAGQVGISGHITLGDGVVMSARSGASKSIDKPGNYGGAPAMLIDNYNRMSVHLRNIEKYVRELKELRTIVDKLPK